MMLGWRFDHMACGAPGMDPCLPTPQGNIHLSDSTNSRSAEHRCSSNLVKQVVCQLLLSAADGDRNEGNSMALS
jgi:hypothetical protein